MKRGLLILLLMLVIFSFSAYAGTYSDVVMKPGDAVVYDGKTIKFLGAQYGDANFEVDGKLGTAPKGQQTLINGVYINVTVLGTSPTIIYADIVINFVCGDGICSSLEDFNICCADCGCLTSGKVCSGNTCIQNISSPSATYECYKDGDCIPKEKCTVARCNTQNIPYVCEHSEKTDCVNDDGCCYKGCTDEQDNDCRLIDRCSADPDCVDNNPCTTDTCTGTPKRCSIVQKEGCAYNNNCYQINSIMGDKICKKDGFTQLKADGAECSDDIECISQKCDFSKCGSIIATSKILKNTLLTLIIIMFVVLFGYIILTMWK